jgi:predicted nucleic acid-binding protein
VKFLLDTNVISEIRKRDRAHPNVVRCVTRTPVEEIGTSVLVLVEIRHGIELKRRNDPSRPNLSIDGSRRCGPGLGAASC